MPDVAAWGEAAAGLAGAALAVALVLAPGARDAAPALVPLALGSIVAWIVWRDMRDFTIPDGAVAALFCLALACRCADATALGEPWGATVVLLALDLALSGGLLLAVREIAYRSRGYDMLGFGDVKLGAAGGILLGASGFALALLAASLSGLALAVLINWHSGTFDGKARLAFGALLAPACLLVWAVGGGPDYTS